MICFAPTAATPLVRARTARLVQTAGSIAVEAELLAFESGCEESCEREYDEVQWQGGQITLHLGVRRGELPRK
jgi:hypothetical protein